MKLPRHILIKGEKYSLETCSNIADYDEADGTIIEDKKQIKISSHLKGKALQVALLHEISHGIQNQTGISEAISEGLQEVIAENFATVLTKLFYIRFK